MNYESYSWTGRDWVTRCGFRKKGVQLPLFMVWREWWRNGEVYDARIVFISLDWIGK